MVVTVDLREGYSVLEEVGSFRGRSRLSIQGLCASCDSKMKRPLVTVASAGSEGNYISDPVRAPVCRRRIDGRWPMTEISGVEITTPWNSPGSRDILGAQIVLVIQAMLWSCTS